VTAYHDAASTPDFTWLISDFVDRVHGVTHALILSADGLALTASRSTGQADADNLAAIASGVLGLARTSSDMFGMGSCEVIIHRHTGGHFLFMPMGDYGGLVVLTGARCDMQAVAHEMSTFVQNYAQHLTPRVRAALRPMATAPRDQG
jgi:uncharacterized protein